MRVIRPMQPSRWAATLILTLLPFTMIGAPRADAMPIDEHVTDAPTQAPASVSVDVDVDPAAPQRATAVRSYTVRLAGPPLAEVYRRDHDQATARGSAPMTTRMLEGRLDAMQRRQELVRRAIEKTGAHVIGSYQVVDNGFLVHAMPRQVEAIAQLPPVISVNLAPIYELDLKDSVPMIGAQRVIDELHYDGKGVTVAIIDTGIDYTHLDLGGSGDAALYRTNNENVVEAGTFPTLKVVGGYDFAGQRYSPGCPQNPPTTTVCSGNPQPDDDPLDPPGQGHGSHVSGIVAGVGTATIHSGVAPGAQLVGLKVFGDPINASASTDLVGLALEWAAKHNLGLTVPGHAPPSKIDVINMSLGSGWGAEWSEGCAAVKAAADAGITVVASAGNSGPIPFIAGTPSICRDALSVASSFASGEDALAIHAAWTENNTPASIEPDALQGAAAWLPQLESRGVFTGTLAYYGLACNDEAGLPSAPAQDVHEKIALIERGTCTFYEKFTNAAKLGAVAVVMFTDDRVKAVMACLAPSPCTVGPGIPGVMIDRAPGLQLRDLMTQGVEVTVVLDPNKRILLEYFTDTISGFSSRGPGRVDGALKPQITAPGSNIDSVGAGTGTGGRQLSGTSMSAPTVAGVAALLWNRNRSEGLELTGADVAALAMNYSTPVIKIGTNTTGPLGAIARQGAGRADAWRSATGDTLVRTDAGFAALGYSNLFVEADGVNRVRRSVSVRNLSTGAKTYQPSSRLAFEDDRGKGISFSFDPPRLTVPAGQTAELHVVLEAEAPALRSWPERVPNWVSSEAFLAQYEMDGHVLLTEVDAQDQAVAGGDVVGVPFYLLPRRRACVSSETAGTFNVFAKDAPISQTWRNPCGLDGLVQPTAAVYFDPAESASDATFLPKVDIESIGVRWGQDPLTTTKNTVLEFQIHTQGGRRIPIDSAWVVYLDLDTDGDFERAISLRAVAGGLEWMVAHAPVATNTLAINLGATSPISYPLAYDLGETTTILRTNAESLGLDFEGGAARFGFAVRHTDSRIEMPRTPTYPGADDAPNGLKATGSPTFVVDQAKLSCLQVVGADGKVHGRYGEAITVPGPGSVTVSLKYACPLPATGEGEVALLSAFPLNAPGPGELDLRRGRFGPSVIYLPTIER